MKTNSSIDNIKNREDIINVEPVDVEKTFHRKLEGIDFDKIAFEAGFQKRKPQKISPKDFLLGFFLMRFSGKNSFEGWAGKISLLINDTVSKQAIEQRIKKGPAEFLKKVLEESIRRSIAKDNEAAMLSSDFNNIIVHDSTCIKLNGTLYLDYPGNGNRFEKIKKSVLKIQTIYDISHRCFISFEITDFRENDQKKAPEIVEIAKEGDLIIRDLGYFVIDSFEKMTDNGIFFISRLKYGTYIYDKNTGNLINLLKTLRKKDFLDMDILLGSVNRLPLRLVAVKLDKKTAAQRRRRARLDRDRRKNHSKEYYELLGWEILITNVDRQRLPLIRVMALYKLRFRIEVIFKCWKSYFKLADVLNLTNRLRLDAYIYSTLIFVVLFQTNFYRYLESIKPEGKQISMMKFSKFIADNILIIFQSEALGRHLPKCFLNQLFYYCCYQHRPDRENYSEKLTLLA